MNYQSIHPHHYPYPTPFSSLSLSLPLLNSSSPLALKLSKMPQKVAPEPKVTFYDLSGPHPWSPYCWRTRFVLNFKALPYQTVKLSYPAIRGTCERLFGEDLDAGNIEATVCFFLMFELGFSSRK
jgi:hypothetical protein